MKTLDKNKSDIVQIYTDEQKNISHLIQVEPKEKFSENNLSETSAENKQTETLSAHTDEKNMEVVKIKPNTYKEIRKSIIEEKNKSIENKEETFFCDEESKNDNSFSVSDNLSEDKTAKEDYTSDENMLFYGFLKKIKIKHKESKALIYVKLFALFFFLGLCVYASGKFGMDGIEKKTLAFFSHDVKGFSDFCVDYSSVIFSSFLVFACGFTLYAPLITVLFSVIVFFCLGVVSGCIAFTLGLVFHTFLVLLLIGSFSVMCIILCSTSLGISKIASAGIYKIMISDGILYSVLYIAFVLITWGISNIISAFVL